MGGGTAAYPVGQKSISYEQFLLTEMLICPKNYVDFSHKLLNGS